MNTPDRSDQAALNRRADELYDQYAKPLEDDHRGEYIAVSPTGQVLLGEDLCEVARQALEASGRGSFLFKLGPRAIARL